MLNGLDTYGIGRACQRGRGAGHDRGGLGPQDAETVAANLETALNTALGIQSRPPRAWSPTGSNVAAGVGEGMGQYSFIGEAFLLAARPQQRCVLRHAREPCFAPAGLNAMRGPDGRVSTPGAAALSPPLPLRAARADLSTRQNRNSRSSRRSRVFEEKKSASWR